MRRSHRVATLCLLVVLAGCGGVLRDRRTVPSVDLGTPSVPAGITADGVDAATLAQTHAAVLAETSYTVRVTEIVGKNGTVLRNATRRRWVAPDADRYLLRRTQRTNGFPTSSLARDLRYWYDGATVVQRVGAGPGARTNQFPADPPGPLRDPTTHRGVARIFAAFEVRPNRTHGAGPVRLSAVRLRDPDVAPTPASVGTPRNATLTAVVDGRGYVRSYRFAYDADASGDWGDVRVVRRVRFVDVGATTVERPAWVEDATRAGS